MRMSIGYLELLVVETIQADSYCDFEKTKQNDQPSLYTTSII